MIPVNPEALKPFASKYVWWKTPDEAVAMPERVIAQVMNMGDYADVQTLAVQVGDDARRKALNPAEAGHFKDRSWLSGITASAWPAWIAFRPCLCGGLRERCLQTTHGYIAACAATAVAGASPRC